jgi:hypothetical protein
MVHRDTLAHEVLCDSEFCYGLQSWTITFIEGLFSVVQSTQDLEVQKVRIRALLQGFGPSWIEHWREAYQMISDTDVDLKKSFEECRGVIRKNKLTTALNELDESIRHCRDSKLLEDLLQDKLLLQRKIHSYQATA